MIWKIQSVDDVRALWCEARHVPLRTEGRKNRHEERYCLGAYLMAQAAYSLLDYPFTVKQGESPDFMMTLRSGERIGLEVRRATEECYQRQVTAAEREYRCRRETAEAPGEEPQPVLIPLSQDGWAGDEPERQCCEMIRCAIEKKVAKLPKYRRASRYDLLIYEDAPLPVGLDLGKMLFLLAPRCNELRATTPELGRISVILGRDVLFDVGGESRLLSYAQWSGLQSADRCEA